MIVLTAEVEPRNRAAVCTGAYPTLYQKPGYDPELIWVPDDMRDHVQHTSPLQGRIELPDPHTSWSGYLATHFIEGWWKLPLVDITLRQRNHLRIEFDDGYAPIPSIFFGLSWLLKEGTIEITGSTRALQEAVIVRMHLNPPEPPTIRQPDFQPASV